MSPHDRFRRLLDRAATRYGLFTRADAAELEVTDKMLRGRLAAGVIERIDRNVYRVSGGARTWRQSLLAACLAGGPRCVVSHRAAAALHGFDGFAPGIVEVTVPHTVRFRRSDIVVHRSKVLPASDCCGVKGIPATTAARTLIDLGAVVPATIVEEALDGAERDRKVGRSELERRHATLRAPGRTGIGAMTAILAGREEVRRIPRSVLERRFLRICERHGLPRPVTRFRLRLEDGTVVELDFAYPLVLLGIETDGHGSHATRRQRAADHRRANAIGGQHWMLRRFTYEQIMNDEPYVAETLRRALADCGVL